MMLKNWGKTYYIYIYNIRKKYYLEVYMHSILGMYEHLT